MIRKQTISADFPYSVNFVEVLGSKMHYIEEGSGDPLLFVHGNPSWSYLWRNVIPFVSPYGRCIAMDLIGMGKSAKPDIEYTFFQHADYLAGFIEAMELDNVCLVLHDWGTALGFHYAMQHEDTIKGIAILEPPFLYPFRWGDYPLPARLIFRLLRAPGSGWFLICVLNLFIRSLSSTITSTRKLTDEEMNYYAAPYPNIQSRKVIRRWPQQIPINGRPADVHQAITSDNNNLRESEVPKLLLYSDISRSVDTQKAEWCRQNINNLLSVSVGSQGHFMQESNPQGIGEVLANWYTGL